MIRRIEVITLVLLAALLAGCGRGVRDSRLEQVEATIGDDPRAALRMLEAIDSRELSAGDRGFYDFLTVKATDKCFIRHTSDSLVLRVIDYAASQRGEGLEAEALYYGGRVYTDLGDYPTALSYYQKALDLLPAETGNLTFRGNVLSQTGDLMIKLKLYDQALPYLEEVVKIDSLTNDSVYLMNDIRMVGTVYSNKKEYDIAESKFKNSRILAKRLNPKDTTQYDLYLAKVKYFKRERDSAINILRPVIGKIDSLDRDMALALACQLYRDAGILDSAYLFSQELIKSPNLSNRRIGYGVMLSPKMKGYIPEDSIIDYVYCYKDEVEKYLNQNGAQEVLIQNSFYNYQVHKRQREKSEASNRRLQLWIGAALLTVLALTLVILWLKYRNKSQLLQLQEAINNVNVLRQSLSQTEKSGGFSERRPVADSQSVHSLRVRLRDELLSIGSEVEGSSEISPLILESEVYGKIQRAIADDRVIPEESPVWKELEAVILESSPEFKYRLNLLTGGRLKPSDFQLAMLIKCGVSPTNMAVLVGRAKATIAYRRESLGMKVFDQKMRANAVDDIIRLL